MIAAAAARLIEGLFAPRQSTRRLLDQAPAMGQSIQLVFLASVIAVVGIGLISVVAPNAAPTGNLLGTVAANIVQGVLTFGLMTALAFAIGRRRGGTGTFEQVAAAVAWSLVVTALFAPFTTVAMLHLQGAVSEAVSREGALSGDPDVGGGTPLSMLVVLFGTGFALWIAASCIAEAHRFKSTVSVLLAMIGVSMAAALLLFVLFGAAMG